MAETLAVPSFCILPLTYSMKEGTSYANSGIDL